MEKIIPILLPLYRDTFVKYYDGDEWLIVNKTKLLDVGRTHPEIFDKLQIVELNPVEKLKYLFKS